MNEAHARFACFARSLVRLIVCYAELCVFLTIHHVFQSSSPKIVRNADSDESKRNGERVSEAEVSETVRSME